MSYPERVTWTIQQMRQEFIRDIVAAKGDMSKVKLVMPNKVRRKPQAHGKLVCIDSDEDKLSEGEDDDSAEES